MQIVHSFKIHLERLGYSQSIVQSLPNCLQEFINFTTKNIEEIESVNISNYYLYLQERPNKKVAGGLSESYIHQHIYGLKLFFEWQEQKGVLEINPISSLEFSSPKIPSREILSLEEIKSLYLSAETVQQRAVLSLFYGCGLRRSEGVELDLQDIHFRNHLLYVRKGKNDKRRVVPMSLQVSRDLKQYALLSRKAVGNKPSFMLNHVGSRMSGVSYNRILKSLLAKTEITKKITLHNLRHSIASHLLAQGLSVEYVRDFLGHKHLESTQIYTHISKEQLWTLKPI